MQKFINAGSVREVVLTKGCTEAINLVAQSFGRQHVAADDEVVVTWMEHHSNIVPWQILCEEKHARLRVVPGRQPELADVDALRRRRVLQADADFAAAVDHLGLWVLAGAEAVARVLDVVVARDVALVLHLVGLRELRVPGAHDEGDDHGDEEPQKLPQVSFGHGSDSSHHGSDLNQSRGSLTE